MRRNDLSHRLAVCSWSLKPADPRDLAAKVEATGIRRVQLALDPLRKAPGTWGEAAALLRAQGVSVVSGMFGCVGEDYSTPETIRATGGLVPDAAWEENWKNVQATATLAQQLGLKLVTFHAGFLPHEQRDAGFARLQERLGQVAEVFGKHDIALGLETGQETAAVLLRFLQALGRPNVGVNFDPANMILYDKGDPIAALRLLGPWIRQVHIKDARRTKVIGTWGEEVVVGTGEVNWSAFFAALDEIGFRGDLCIEREAGDRSVEDICSAREFLGRMLA